MKLNYAHGFLRLFAVGLLISGASGAAHHWKTYIRSPNDIIIQKIDDELKWSECNFVLNDNRSSGSSLNQFRNTVPLGSSCPYLRQYMGEIRANISSRTISIDRAEAGEALRRYRDTKATENLYNTVANFLYYYIAACALLFICTMTIAWIARGFRK